MSSENVSLDTTGHSVQGNRPTYPGRSTREGAHYDGTAPSTNKPPTSDRLELANSTVVLEHGPAGPIARIEREGGREYVGPLAEQTVGAFWEVGR